MPFKIESDDLPEKETDWIDYNPFEDDFYLQTGDVIRGLTSDAKIVEGYFDGTVRWKASKQAWEIQVRTGDTDAYDLSVNIVGFKIKG